MPSPGGVSRVGDDFLGNCRNKQTAYPIELVVCRLLIG